MFSGKTAVSDILREFQGVHVNYYRHEFDLLRVPGGLIDLKNAVLNWSPIRTYGAVCRFDRLVNKFAYCPKFPKKLYKSGLRYAERYPNIIQFKNEFLDSIIAVQWDTPWPYSDIDDGPFDTFTRKILSKFSIEKSRKYFLVDKRKFIPEAQKFIRRLMMDSMANSQSNSVVINNALEPFSPGANLDLLGDESVCIVVDRDPRDIYATFITKQVGFNDNPTLYRQAGGAHDLDVFIKRHQIYRRNITFGEDRVLRIEFKNLVLDYEQSLQKICEFTGIEGKYHVNKGKYFNIKKSINNLESWKNSELVGFANDFERIAAECDIQGIAD